MNRLPEVLLESIKNAPGFVRESFLRVHSESFSTTSIRINPGKTSDPLQERPVKGIKEPSYLGIEGRVPWSRFGLYLSKRPSFTFDPLFHAGCYYVQEASSMFLEQALTQCVDLSMPLRVLDLCGAPGGKTTHLQSLISAESLLVSNEVIRSRASVLIDNVVKWGSQNVLVTNNDPSAFKKMEGYFDVMVVDAPCSGSGLFRKDPDAIGEWSPENVTLCHQRQQRILADALPSLKEGGILIYSTCSYSPLENEDVADWLLEDIGMKSLPLTIDSNWGITVSTSPRKQATGYRFYPDKLKGEGFFIACFKKLTTGGALKIKPQRTEKANSRDLSLIRQWLNLDIFLFQEEQSYYALPEYLYSEYALLNKMLNIVYKGVKIGQIMKDKLIPDHALAMTNLVATTVPRQELSYEEAIRYLQKQDLQIAPSLKGWQLTSYEGNNLGWINVLSNRINNYYPKELRILKRDIESFKK